MVNADRKGRKMISPIFRSRLSRAVAGLFAALSVAALATTAMAAQSRGQAQSREQHLRKDPKIAALVPQAIRQTGVLRVGTAPGYAPFEFVDPKSNKIVGFDPDLAQGLATVLGLKLILEPTTFDTLIPSLAAGKFDIAMSSIGDNKAREQVLNFVTYYWNQSNLLVPKGNPKSLAIKNGCGANVGVVRGSAFVTVGIPYMNSFCQGQPPVNPVLFDSAADADVALAAGRIDAVLADAITQDAVAAKSNGQFVTVRPALRNFNPGGVAIPKDNGLTSPIYLAMTKLFASLYYKAEVKKWNMWSAAIRNPEINGALQ
jgi:polar amino acid transport system substrate-binding protein